MLLAWLLIAGACGHVIILSSLCWRQLSPSDDAEMVCTYLMALMTPWAMGHGYYGFTTSLLWSLTVGAGAGAGGGRHHCRMMLGWWSMSSTLGVDMVC